MADNLPKSMRVVAIAEPGGPEVLRIEQRPVPRPALGEVLVRVSYAGVNRPDCLQRAGLYAPPPGANDLPGLEISGEVVGVGPGVEPEMLNQPVCALTDGGGYAEYCCVPAHRCLPAVEGLTMAAAAAWPLRPR